MVGRRVLAKKVDAVSGFVGGSGGLEGFLPPLVVGAVHETSGRYTIGLLLLAVVAAMALVYSLRRFESAVTRE